MFADINFDKYLAGLGKVIHKQNPSVFF